MSCFHPRPSIQAPSNQRRFALTTLNARRGRAAENLSLWFFRQRGFQVLGRNFNCNVGELDLIVLDPRARLRTIHFIEVKTRLSNAHNPPQTAVTRSKQKKIHAAARYWILKNNPPHAVFLFDIIAIDWPRRGIPRVRWYKNAFFPSDPMGWRMS